MTVVDVAVIGAGPYGLALAAHLKAGGVDFRIFGSPMSTWTDSMPSGMFLKSEGFASNIAHPDGGLTLEQFCAETGTAFGDYGVPIPVEVFVAYGKWFQERAVPSLERTAVSSVERSGDCYDLRLASGEHCEARNVVFATGFRDFAHVPAELRNAEPGRVTHTSDHTSFEALAGADVGVVGCGQSALETAALLHEQGARPCVLARAATVAWNADPVLERPLRRRLRMPRAPLGDGWKLWSYSNVPSAFTLLPDSTRVRLVSRTLGPAGGWWLRSRVEGVVPVLTERTVVAVRQEGERLKLSLRSTNGSEEMDFDHLIAGTGYRVDVDRIGLLAPDLRARLTTVAGSPRLTRHFESSVPGLFFIGLPAAHTFGPVMRFVCGTGFAARRVAARVAALGRA